MSYTLDENGTALTETRGSVTLPSEYSFSIVNDFVHSTGVSFEELQWLCLGLASDGEKLRAELEQERGRVKALTFALEQAKTSMLDSGYSPSAVVIRACDNALSAGEGGETSE